MSRPPPLRFALASLLLSAAARAQDPASAPPAEPPAAGAEDELPPLLKDPAILDFVQAPYPEAAKAEGVEGSVLLLIEIDATGAITAVEVLGPAGHGFDEAATAAAWQFRFSPAEDETGPVPVAIEFNYGFVLDAASTEGAVPQEAASEPVEAAPAPVNLEGTVVEMGTRRPLADFPVRVEPPGGEAVETITDKSGHFEFRGVPNATVSVTTIYPGYDRATQSIEVVEGQVTSFKLWVRNQGYRDDDLISVYQKEREEVTRRTLTMEEVRRVPGTFGDPVRVIQSLPGAARTPFGTGLLVIRGANPEDSAVYIDGIRVPLIYHLGGFESVISPDIVEAVDYLPGGYGVEYGRSLGGVVDVKTKTEFPDGKRVAWSTDLLDSGGVIEGKAGKDDQLGFAVAGRRSYINLFIPYFLDDPDTVIEPRWWDYQLKLEHLGLEKGKLSAFIFGFKDSLTASSPGNQGTDADTQGALGTAYTTHRLLLQYERPLGEHLTFRVTPSAGIDGSDLSLGNDLRLEQTITLFELRSELEWTPSESATVTGGVDFLGGFYDFSVQLPFDPAALGNYDPLAEREPYTLASRGSAWGPDAYLDLSWRPLAERDRLLIKPGVRVNYTTVLDQVTVFSADPRLAARWEVVEHGTLKLGAGLYHQPPQPFEIYRPDGNVELASERAWSGELGWEHQITGGLSADATVFYKWLDNLIVSNPSFSSLDDPYFFNEGNGRVYGAEFLIRKAPVGRFFGWLSYTLSRSERNDYPDTNGDDGWYIYDIDQTHILVLTAGYKLPYDFELSGRFTYVTGNPTTPYAGGVYDIDQDFYYGYQTASRNTERLPPYIAADFRASKLLTFKFWQLELYMDVINAIRGVNPEFQLYNYDYTESRYIRGLPIIPSPGFEAEFHF